MKILFVLQSIPVGGVASVIMNYYREISNEISADFAITSSPKVMDPEFEEYVKAHGGNIYYLPHFAGKNMYKYFFQIWCVIRNGRYDIIHDNDKYFGFLSLIPAYIYRIPKRISHVHNNVDTNDKSFLHRIFIRISSLLTKNIANYHLACSQLAGESMYGKTSFDILLNAIDVTKYKFKEDNRSKYRKELGIGSEFVLTTVARNDSLKRYDFAFRVFSCLQKLDMNSKYIIIGMSEGELSRRDRDAYNLLTVQEKENVIFLGRRMDANLLLSSADAFLLTSDHEGFGISVVEAQANGMQCYISDAVPIETKITDLVHFLPCVKNPELWASTIIKYKNVNRKHNAYEIIMKSNFSIKSQVNKIKSIYGI